MPRMKHGPHRAARRFVAQRLKALRELRGVSQDQLADKAGLHRSYVGVIERQEKGVGIDVLGKLCDALGVTMQEFFSDKR